MRQIEDARAPFESFDTALEIGKQHIHALGWAPVAIVIEDQPGGHYVRIVGTTHVGRGGRRGKNKHQHHVAEVGRLDRGSISN